MYVEYKLYESYLSDFNIYFIIVFIYYFTLLTIL